MRAETLNERTRMENDEESLYHERDDIGIVIGSLGLSSVSGVETLPLIR